MFNNGGSCYNRKDKGHNVCRILSIGSSLQLNITLSLTEKQCLEYAIQYKGIVSLHQLKQILIKDNGNGNSNNRSGTCTCNTGLIALMTLTSENALINSLLFINKANKTKSFIEYMVPFTAVYNTEYEFMKDIVKNVTERNLLFIEEHNLLNIKPELTFTFKVLANNDNTILKQQTVLIADQCQRELSQGGNEGEAEGETNYNEYNGDLFRGFGLEYNYTIFYSTIKDLFKCKLHHYDEILSFFNHLIQERPSILLCIDYSGIFEDAREINIEFIKAVDDLLHLSDISIFEKKDAADLFNLSKTIMSSSSSSNSSKSNPKLFALSQSHNQSHSQRRNIEQIDPINPEDFFIREIRLNQIRSKAKIGIFIDEMKLITIIQQNSDTNIVLYHSNFNINYLPPNTLPKDVIEYNTLLSKRYPYIKSIYTGGFLSRLFNKKAFQTCVTAGNESVKRIIDILRFNLDIPIDPSFYEILIKKPKAISRQELIIKKKEEQFLLDCTNVTSSKKKIYNPLYDNMCESYFSNDSNRNHLLKLGFIDKKGRILQDPESIIYRTTKDKLLMKKYFKESKNLAALKEKNEVMKSQIRSIAFNINSINNASSIEELNYLTKVNNQESFAKRKLPLFELKMNRKGNNGKDIGIGGTGAGLGVGQGINGSTGNLKHDLYFREIMNSIFFKKNEGHNGTNRRNNYNNTNSHTVNEYTNKSGNVTGSGTVYGRNRSVDRDHFVGLLNDLEKRIHIKKD